MRYDDELILKNGAPAFHRIKKDDSCELEIVAFFEVGLNYLLLRTHITRKLKPISI